MFYRYDKYVIFTHLRLIESVTCVWPRSIYLSRGWSVLTNPSRGLSRDLDVTTDHPRLRSIYRGQTTGNRSFFSYQWHANKLRSKKGFSIFLSIQYNLAMFQPQFTPVSKFIKATCYIPSSSFIHVLSKNDGLIGGLVISSRDNPARQGPPVFSRGKSFIFFMPKLTSDQPNGLFYVLFLSILRLFGSLFIFLLI